MMLELGLLVVETHTQLNAYMIPFDLKSVEMFNITSKGGCITIESAVSLTCPFCGRVGTTELMGKYVCEQCVKQLKKTRRKRNVGSY